MKHAEELNPRHVVLCLNSVVNNKVFVQYLSDEELHYLLH